MALSVAVLPIHRLSECRAVEFARDANSGNRLFALSILAVRVRSVPPVVGCFSGEAAAEQHIKCVSARA